VSKQAEKQQAKANYEDAKRAFDQLLLKARWVETRIRQQAEGLKQELGGEEDEREQGKSR
jgi:hypothetical protein